MKNDNHHIDQFFRDSFQDFSSDSAGNLWERLDGKLSSSLPVADTGKTNAILRLLSINSKAAAFLAAASVTVFVAVAGFILYDNYIDNSNDNFVTTYNDYKASPDAVYIMPIPVIINKLSDSPGIAPYLSPLTENSNIKPDNIAQPVLVYKPDKTENIVKKVDDNSVLKNHNDIFVAESNNTGNKLVNNNPDLLTANNSQEVNQLNSYNYSVGHYNNNAGILNHSSMLQPNPAPGVLNKDSSSRTAINQDNNLTPVVAVINENSIESQKAMLNSFGVDAAGNSEIQELKLNPEIHSQLLVFPNVFTPNNDGVNDYFTILGIDNCASNRLVVSDRNGRNVFETTNYRNNWDAGNIPDGVYYFIFVCQSNVEDMVKKGVVTVLR